MIRVVLSEWLKTKRTIIRWLIFFLPLCFSACMAAYCAYRADLSVEFIYEAFYMVWAALMMPVGIGVITGYYIYEEEAAGDFNNLLNIVVPKGKLYLGKFFLSVISLTICTILTTLMICIGLKVVRSGNIGAVLFLAASLLAVCGSLPILAVHVWVSFTWGMGASAGLGIAGILMAVLMGTTSLGDKLWYVLPWTYPVKMAMFPMSLSLMSEAASGVIRQFVLAVVLSIVFSIIFLAGGLAWFHNWEGPKSSE